MRPILLFFIAITTANSLFAQLPADYRFELGVNGGISANTLPTGPDPLYTGTKTIPSAEFSARFHYNLNENWQIGIDLGRSKWTTTANWALTDVNGQTLQSKKVTFNIAEPATSFCAQLNRLKGYRSRYKEYNKANFYYGISLGTIVAANDGSMGQSAYGQSPDPKLMYTSSYNYGYGIGYLAGLQVGLSYYIWENFGVNFEIAGREAYVWNNDSRYSHANDEYNIFYFPITVGLRYRF